ncbi:hypothetical protein I4F81_008421 [Pyropia yezoensis]|uniref:Uncharacterized protein n=1 Tax=Pyropia yezoensis TaxID=2788 RepID=A0ACC3C749_PYRYE|nr:hypothetical protein I4F81_008421 [Neopyropia yezoensis]
MVLVVTAQLLSGLRSALNLVPRWPRLTTVALVADLTPLPHRLTTVTLVVRLGATAQPVPPPVHGCAAVALVQQVVGVALVADLPPLLHRLSPVTLEVRLGVRLEATAQPVPPPVHGCAAVTLAQHVMGVALVADLVPPLHRLSAVTLAVRQWVTTKPVARLAGG